MINLFSLNWSVDRYSLSSIKFLSIYILWYPYGLTLTILRVILLNQLCCSYLSMNQQSHTFQNQLNYFLCISLLFQSFKINITQFLFWDQYLCWHNFFITCHHIHHTMILLKKLQNLSSSFITYIINITTFLKVISSNWSSLSIKILALSIFQCLLFI